MDIAVGVEVANIASMQPAVAQHGVGAGFIVPIAVHDHLATRQNLTVFGNLDFNPLERRAHRVQFDLVGGIATDDRRRFGLAIALQQPDAERGEENTDLRVKRRAARNHRFQAPAKTRAHFIAHQAF